MKTFILNDANQEKPSITSKSDVCAIPGIANNKTVWFRAVPDNDLKTWIVNRTQFNSPQQAIAQDYRFSGKFSKSVLFGAINRARYHIDNNESTQAMHDLEILVEAAQSLEEREAFIFLQESLMQNKDKQFEALQKENEELKLLESDWLINDREKLKEERDSLKSTIQLMEHGKYGRVDLTNQILSLKSALESTREENRKMREVLEAFKNGVRYESQQTAFRLLNEVNI